MLLRRTKKQKKQTSAFLSVEVEKNRFCYGLRMLCALEWSIASCACEEKYFCRNLNFLFLQNRSAHAHTERSTVSTFMLLLELSMLSSVSVKQLMVYGFHILYDLENGKRRHPGLEKYETPRQERE